MARNVEGAARLVQNEGMHSSRDQIQTDRVVNEVVDSGARGLGLRGRRPPVLRRRTWARMAVNGVISGGQDITELHQHRRKSDRIVVDRVQRRPRWTPRRSWVGMAVIGVIREGQGITELNQHLQKSDRTADDGCWTIEPKAILAQNS